MTGAAVFLLALTATLATVPLPADRLPQELLAACDARALPLTRAAPAIADAAAALIEIGAFRRDDFRGAALGFCGFQRAGGPVAATSCEHGIILLDEKYAAAGQTLNLRATLAHELTHHRQHQERKARFGESYCASPRYEADKPRFEADADAVGDKVAALFLRGRGVEIVNACDAVVSIYLEADNPVAVRGAEAAFQRIPARSAALSPERALSGRFRFHARTAPDAGKIHVWENKTSAETRIIEGRTARLRSIRLSAPDRLDAPFRLRLACPGGAR